MRQWECCVLVGLVLAQTVFAVGRHRDNNSNSLLVQDVKARILAALGIKKAPIASGKRTQSRVPFGYGYASAYLTEDVEIPPGRPEAGKRGLSRMQKWKQQLLAELDDLS